MRQWLRARWSFPPIGWISDGGRPAGRLVHWWWVLFLLSGFLGAIGGAITVFAAAAPIIFVRRTSGRQDERIADSETQGAT